MEDESFDIVELENGTIEILHVIYEAEAMGGNDIETFYSFDVKNSSKFRECLPRKRNNDLQKAFHATFAGVSDFIAFCDKNKLKYSVSKRY